MHKPTFLCVALSAFPWVTACSSAGDDDRAVGAANASVTADAGAREPIDVEAVAREIADRYASKRDLVCPGETIAMSCGNFRCDSVLGETKTSCPADCAFHKLGAYNKLPICTNVQSVVVPNSVAEVKTAVRAAVAAGQRVRPVGARHSASQTICGDGVALVTEKLSRLEDIEIRGNIAYTPPGVTMKALASYLHDRGYSVGYTHLGFNGVTVAGAIGTSAHGSSPIHNNTLSHRVASFDVVGPDGEERRYDKATTPTGIFHALEANLGLLGVVTRVGLELDPAFNLDTTVDYLDESSLFDGAGALPLVRGCDWGQMNWFPGQHRVVRWCGKATTEAADPTAHNVLLDPGVPSLLVPIAKGLFHKGTCNGGMACLMEKVRLGGLESRPPIATKNRWGITKHVAHAVGRSADMMSASLIDLGKNVYFQMDWEVAVPQKHIQSALELARSVFEKRNICLPGVGVFVRFGLIEEGGWLSYHGAGGEFHAGETAMFFETPVTVPAGYSEAELAAYLDVYQEIIFALVDKFGARAHWGKNLESVFARQVQAGTYGPRMAAFNDAVATLDPYGVFANDFGTQIGVTWPHQGEDFSRVYAGNSCGCGVEAAPVCDRRSELDFASTCRAACNGKKAEDLLPDTCDRYRFAKVPLTGVRMAYRDGSVIPASIWRD